MDKVIEIKNLTKKYKKQLVLKNINFQCSSGEVLAIIGPNGSGKTTLFKIITGLVFPTSGTVSFNDYTSIGALIGSPVFYEHLTGYQNLRLFSRDKETILNLSKEFEICDYLYKRVRLYSLGMKQRLALVKVFLNNPKLVLLDEPTNGLDIEGVKILRDKIALYRELGTTIIISSHIMAEIELIYNRVGVLYNGNLIMHNKDKMLTSYKYLISDVNAFEEILKTLKIQYRVDYPYVSIQVNKDNIGSLNKVFFSKGIEIHEIIPEKPSLEHLYFNIIVQSNKKQSVD